MEQLDDLIEQNPSILKNKEEARKEDFIEGLQKGVVIVVARRFPPLAEFAQERIAKVTKPDQLELLLRQFVLAPDESIARWILTVLQHYEQFEQ